jgi:hypothetical protein
MKRLIVFLVFSLNLLACSFAPGYLDCLYSHLSKNPFKVNGAFYVYDFNKNGVIERNDWIYIDLSTKKAYRLLGKRPSLQDAFGWQPITSLPSDLNIENVTGLFVYINFTQDLDSRFSWIYIPLSDPIRIYKLDGSTANGDFVYLDLNCDGWADPLPDLTIKEFDAPNDTLLPGTTQSSNFTIRFAYTGTTPLGCGGFSSSSVPSSSSQNSSGSSIGSGNTGAFPQTSSSSMASNSEGAFSSGGCFVETNFKNLYELNASNQGTAINPSIMFVSGLALKDGYIVGGSISQNLHNPSNQGLDGYVAKLDRSGNVVWSFVLYNDEDYQYRMDEWVQVYQIDNDFFVGLTKYNREGSGAKIRAALVGFNGSGKILWKKQIFMPSAIDDFDGEYLRITNIVPLHNQNFLLVGEAKPRFLDDQGNPIYPQVAVAIRMNSKGEVIWSKLYNGEKFYFPYASGTSAWGFINGIEKNGSIYLVGYLNHTIDFGGSSILIAKLDQNGQLLWRYAYNRKQGTQIYSDLATAAWSVVSVPQGLALSFTDANYGSASMEGVMIVDENGALKKAVIVGEPRTGNYSPLRKKGSMLYLGLNENIMVMDEKLRPIHSIAGGIDFMIDDLLGVTTLNLFLITGTSTITRYDAQGLDCYGISHAMETAPFKEVTSQFFRFDPKGGYMGDRAVRFAPMKTISPARKLHVKQQCKKEYTICIN